MPPRRVSDEVRYPKDPERKRWGRQSKRDGYIVDASFRELEAVDWVTIELEVRGSEGHELSGPVTFFVHPTFPQQAYEVEPRDGIARLQLNAWGGFTVGVWIHRGGIPLELNLAAIEDAPRIIKER